MKLIKRLSAGNNPIGLFECEVCGDKIETNLYQGQKSKSCKKCSYKLRTTHKSKNSDSQFEYVRRGSRTRLYRIWNAMKTRCYNPKAINYKHYGGKGVKMIQIWKESYKHFAEWALQNGYNESNETNLEIDRIDSSGNYMPSNCRWINKRDNVAMANIGRTKKVYTYNLDGTFFAEYYGLTEASKATGVNISNISANIGTWGEKRAGNFMFRDFKSNNIKPYTPNHNFGRKYGFVPVRSYMLATGEYLNTFDDLYDAATAYNIKTSHAVEILKGIRTHSRGIVLRWASITEQGEPLKNGTQKEV